MEKISLYGKQVLTYMGATLYSEGVDPKTGQHFGIKNLFKPGWTRNGWIAFNKGGQNIGRSQGYTNDKSFHLLNARRDNHESDFMGIASSTGNPLIQYTEEYYVWNNGEAVEAMRALLFRNDIKNWVSDRIFGGKVDLRVPAGMVQSIKDEFSKYPYNMSTWDEKKCINILNDFYGMIKNGGHPLLPGRNIYNLKFSTEYRYNTNNGPGFCIISEFIDLRKIRYIDITFKGEYTPRTVRMDLYSCLACNVLNEAGEDELGSGVLTAEIISPSSIYPNNFQRNGRLLMESVKEGRNISKVSLPGSWEVFNPCFDPKSDKYFPAILDPEGKIIGVDGLSIIAIAKATEHVKDHINRLIEKLPLEI